MLINSNDVRLVLLLTRQMVEVQQKLAEGVRVGSRVSFSPQFEMEVVMILWKQDRGWGIFFNPTQGSIKPMVRLSGNLGWKPAVTTVGTSCIIINA